MRSVSGNIRTDRNKRRDKEIQANNRAGEGKSNLSFLIVKDMLLTGFDAQCTGYVSNRKQLTSTLQAIARKPYE